MLAGSANELFQGGSEDSGGPKTISLKCRAIPMNHCEPVMASTAIDGSCLGMRSFIGGTQQQTNKQS